MSGIFGTGAGIQIDLNLATQIVMFVLIIVGWFYKSKKRFKLHGELMGIAVVLHIISFVTVMGPVFFEDFDLFVDYISESVVQTTWVHAIPGAIAMILGIILVGSWVLHPKNIAACSKKKRLMDITTVLWFISLIFGIATYILFYT